MGCVHGNRYDVSMGTGRLSVGISWLCLWEMVGCVHGNWWAVPIVPMDMGGLCPWKHVVHVYGILVICVHGNCWAMSMGYGWLCPWELVGCAHCAHGHGWTVSMEPCGTCLWDSGDLCPWELLGYVHGRWLAVSMGTSGLCPWKLVDCVHGNC